LFQDHTKKRKFDNDTERGEGFPNIMRVCCKNDHGTAVGLQQSFNICVLGIFCLQPHHFKMESVTWLLRIVDSVRFVVRLQRKRG
jgi:hypothetical protein